MYISLQTLDVWEFDAAFDAARLFQAIHLLCDETDLLVIGSYNPSEEALHWLTANETVIATKAKPFSDSFDFNRKDFPLGKAYIIPARQERLAQLSLLSTEEHGSRDKKLFFDHVLLYRPSTPILPLMNFHNAFNGGQLYLSGHYSHEAVNLFSTFLAVTAKLTPNPERCGSA